MITPWQEESSEIVFKKYSFTIEKRDYRQPSGGISDFYVRTGPNGTCALALTPDKKVITVRQFRPGPRTIFNELPGGFVDPGLTPEEGAALELKQETGFEGDLQYGGFYYEDAYTDRQRHWVVVTNCRKVGDQDLEPTEFAEVVLMDLPDFVAQVREGRMTDTAAAMLGLDKLGLL